MNFYYDNDFSILFFKITKQFIFKFKDFIILMIYVIYKKKRINEIDFRFRNIFIIMKVKYSFNIEFSFFCSKFS